MSRLLPVEPEYTIDLGNRGTLQVIGQEEDAAELWHTRNGVAHNIWLTDVDVAKLRDILINRSAAQHSTIREVSVDYIKALESLAFEVQQQLRQRPLSKAIEAKLLTVRQWYGVAGGAKIDEMLRSAEKGAST